MERKITDVVTDLLTMCVTYKCSNDGRKTRLKKYPYNSQTAWQSGGPTGGYLISYPFAAATAGVAAGTVARPPRRRAIAAGLASGLIGLAMIYALGATWLAVQSNLTPGAAFAAGALPFVPFDVAKVLLATLVAVATAPVVSQVRTRRSDPALKGRGIRWTSGT